MSIPTTKAAEPQRFHALDSVRAAAMLLGVVYHALLFRMFTEGGTPMGPMAFSGPSNWLADWLHGFRMPLFFLISGFFGRMMLQKYGTLVYLRKRWYRIAIPMVIGMFTFGPAYVLTREAVSSFPGPGGGPGGPMGGPPPNLADLPPPPPGFVPPPLLRFDVDNDGSLSADEWKKAQKELGPPPGFPPGPGFGPGGPDPGFGPGGPGPGGPMPGPFGQQAGALSTQLFGSNSRLFQLNHLWFLWYLLVFVTIAPWLTWVLGWLLGRPTPEAADRFGLGLIRSGFAPLALGLISVPALMIAPSPFGWTLGLPPSIFRAFPDFLLHLDPDMALFLIYFLAGWWLHREREALPSIAHTWLPDVILGLVAFAAATALHSSYGFRTQMPHYSLIRIAGYCLYSISAAATAFGFLGAFQRYLDRPSPVGRYFADTALWVYLVHQPLVLLGLSFCQPLHSPWWVQTALVSLFAVAASLLLYEAFVRPTPLVKLFGPVASRREFSTNAQSPP